MPTNCDHASSDGYAVKHNPAAYYPRIASQCLESDVPFGSSSSGRFLSDVESGTLATFSFVTPDLCHDTHDCSVSTGDNWLRAVVGRITQSAVYRAGRTAIFITWDEGESSANHIPTIVVAPSVLPGTQSGIRVDHYGLLRTTEEMLGLGLIGRAASAASVRAVFRL
jgi:hypothetical protein